MSTGKAKPTVVFIGGLCTTPGIWDRWAARYKKAGHEVLAPVWPVIEGDAESARRNPSALIGLPLQTVVDHYERIVRGLESPPILVGHGFGGLIVQLLADRGLGVAGVVIDRARSEGVPARAFAPVESRLAALVMPNGARTLWNGALSFLKPKNESGVRHARSDKPALLFIAEGEARAVTPAVNTIDIRRYARSMAITAYLEFPERAYNTLSHAGWEQIADLALNWALGNSRHAMSFDDVKAALSPSRVLTESREHEARM
jgi:pimeloyl-ACP methyl ester carboxylesterase